VALSSSMISCWEERWNLWLIILFSQWAWTTSTFDDQRKHFSTIIIDNAKNVVFMKRVWDPVNFFCCIILPQSLSPTYILSMHNKNNCYETNAKSGAYIMWLLLRVSSRGGGVCLIGPNMADRLPRILVFLGLQRTGQPQPGTITTPTTVTESAIGLDIWILLFLKMDRHSLSLYNSKDVLFDLFKHSAEQLLF